MPAVAWSSAILLGWRPPQVPRERHLRLGPQRGEFPGRAFPLRGGFPGGPPGGGEVNPQLLRLAECPGQPVPQADGLTAGPGDKFLDLAPVIAAPRDLEPFLRCRAGQKISVAAPFALRQGRRDLAEARSRVREAGRSHQPRCLPDSARAVVLSPAELMSPPDDPAPDGATRRHAKGSDHFPHATSRGLCTPLCICPDGTNPMYAGTFGPVGYRP